VQGGKELIPIGRRNAPPKDENDVDLNKLASLIGIPPTYAHKTLDDFEGDEDKELLEKYIENIHQMFEDKINLMFSGANGSGKAQPLDAKVLTENGWSTIGELKIGDKVYTRKGMLSKVLNIFPQGRKKCYKVTLLDGRTTECCDEHLWSYFTSRGNINTITLKEMIEAGFKNNSNSYKFHIPNNECITFYNNEELPIDPYLLGVLIGDGCLTCSGVIYSNDEDDIKERVQTILGNDYRVKKINSYNYSISISYLKTQNNPLSQAITKLGLRVNSQYKFIPKEYLFSSIENRMQLLKGLMDTDGYFNNGRFSFSSKSKTLIDDFIFLCRSLGYQCTLYSYNRANSGLEYRVNILTKDCIVSSNKHISKYKQYVKEKRNSKNKSNYFKTPIISAEFIGYKEMKCILIADNEHLYLTDDFIVTHNTLSASLILKYAVLNYYTARLINFKSYISLLYKKNKTDQEIEKLEKIQECEFLCIDELGKETETESENEKTVLLEIIKKREVEGLVTITCFNIPFKHLEDRYGKTFCDTIVNSSVKVEFGTKSKRKDALKQKKAYKILAGECNEEDN
jgi:hypothetical protein